MTSIVITSALELYIATAFVTWMTFRLYLIRMLQYTILTKRRTLSKPPIAMSGHRYGLYSPSKMDV